MKLCIIFAPLPFGWVLIAPPILEYLAALTRQGGELYGGHLPLQSIRQSDESYKCTTGYRDGDSVTPAPVSFPTPPENPLMALQVQYVPSKLKERDDEALFKLYPFNDQLATQSVKPYAEGGVPIRQPFYVGEYAISAKEVRYWTSMVVRYEPGKPVSLTSLWIGLAGMIITTLGRMLRGRKMITSAASAILEYGAGL